MQFPVAEPPNEDRREGRMKNPSRFSFGMTLDRLERALVLLLLVLKIATIVMQLVHL